MAKCSNNSELNIITTYLRTNQEFSLTSQRQETNLEFGKCNYYTDRKESSLLQYIIQTWSFDSLEATLAKMLLPPEGNIQQLKKTALSVHYIIDKDGSIYQLVPDNKKAWPAKCGELKTGSILNPDIAHDLKNDEMHQVSISIMSINNGKEPFPPIQVEKNLYLCNDLLFKHHIKRSNVIALSDWAVGNSIAPGPYFPWKKFAEHGMGIWSNVERTENPDMIISHLPSNKHISFSLEELPKLLEKFYKLGMPTKNYTKLDLTNYALLQTNMLKFNLHYLGPQIIANPELKKLYDEVLYKDPTELYAKARLASWNENSRRVLDDLVGIKQIGDTVTQWDAADNYMAFC